MDFDVVIIGGGVVGANIFNKLTLAGKKCLLIEKENDVATKVTKANSGLVHAGFDPKPGTLMAKLNVRGNALYGPLCKRLGVDLVQSGALVVSTTRQALTSLYNNARKNGCPNVSIISRSAISKLCPNLKDNYHFALYAKNAYVVSPYLFTIALVEEAILNGGQVMLNTQVVSSVVYKNKVYLHTNNEQIKADYVINAAGDGYNSVAKALGTEQYNFTYTKGEYYLLDKSEIGLTSITVFPLPTKLGKGVMVTPTADGNILIGPSATVGDDDTDTTHQGLDYVKEQSQKLFDIDFKKCIRNFAGVRIKTGNDFVVKRSTLNKHVINIAGICSPGLSASPAIAEMVEEMLYNSVTPTQNLTTGKTLPNGLKFTKRTPYTVVSKLNDKQLNELIKKDPNYGKIICKCEKVTYGQLLEVLHSPLPPTSMDGIKRRIRIGMGRCQGGFCANKVVEELAQFYNLKMEDIPKEQTGSNFVMCDINKRSK